MPPHDDSTWLSSMQDDPLLFDYNVEERVNDFVAAALAQVQLDLIMVMFPFLYFGFVCTLCRYIHHKVLSMLVQILSYLVYIANLIVVVTCYMICENVS